MNTETPPRAGTGIVYVAFGYEYFLMAAYSALTARETNPGISCSVVTNLKVGTMELLRPFFDHVFEVGMRDDQNRLVKTSVADYAPFEKCVFMDCDTQVCGSLDPMFLCLDRYDVLLKMSARPTPKDYTVPPGVPGHLFPSWNSGVIFFRNGPPARKLFADWHTNFVAMEKSSDQPALACALAQNSGLRVLPLTAVWNTFPSDTGFLRGFKSRIWHYRYPDSYPKLAAAIFALHSNVSGALTVRDACEADEIRDVGSKYHLMSSALYRYSVCRNLVLRPLQFLHLAPRVVLRRSKRRLGGSFERATDG